MMMIRPHDGGFAYRPRDIDVMRAEIETAHELGVHGVVFGALTPGGEIDCEICQRLLDSAGPLATTFHRAFDIVNDPVKSLEQLIELGFDRVLTSGQAAQAVHGISLIGRLQELAQERITILAGSGVNAENASEIVTATGVGELHASASRQIGKPSAHEVSFGAGQRVTQAELVRAIKQAVSGLQ